MPSSVEAGQPFLGRITRHELSHIAVGIRDNGAPAWVSEGLAQVLAERTVEAIDRFAIADRARLTLPTIRRALAQGGLIDIGRAA